MLHVVSENKRVLEMKDALGRGDLFSIGEILKNSHSSLSGNYGVSCPEIDLIIDISIKQKGFWGGRIMGGGFGGCTINLIEKSELIVFSKKINEEFCNRYNYNLLIEEVDFSEGMKVFNCKDVFAD